MKAARHSQGSTQEGNPWGSAGPALTFLHFSCQAASHGLLLASPVAILEPSASFLYPFHSYPRRRCDFLTEDPFL